MKRKRTEHPLDVAIREMAAKVLADPKLETQRAAFGIDGFDELLVEIRVGLRIPKGPPPATGRVKVYDRFGKEVIQ